MSNDHEIAAALAKAIALVCVRNTDLEKLHAGKSPDSKTGDYSDVKVVTPYGEIPWNELSRINDDEMKELMQEIVSRLYTFLRRQDDPNFIRALDRLASPYVSKWDEPELAPDFELIGYPGDIFYLHARLLERSTQLAKKYGGGSMTALPVVETQQGEIAAYIPTNLISITDGQIYFDTKLFAGGMLPAIDIGRSVSRIGGAAQEKAIKDAASHIRLDYLQFLELELFARFGTRLEKGVEEKLRRGRILREILKQDRLTPRNEKQHLAWLLAYAEGLFESYTPVEAAATLPKLFNAVAAADLKLDDPKERWVSILRTVLPSRPHDKTA